MGNLDTSNGPALEVWLTDAPVLPGRDGWNVFDDGRYVSLGELKGNKGNANYADIADSGLPQVPRLLSDRGADRSLSDR